jgi:diguanylate cyclase (GGDEF)-like protein
MVAVPVQGALASVGLGSGPWWVLWVATLVTPLVGAALFVRSRARPALVPVSSLLWFLASVALSAVVPALLYLPIGTVGGWLVAWQSVAVGMLVGAPLVLSWESSASPRRRLEVVLTAGSTVLVSLLVFGTSQDVVEVTLPYLALPPVTWAALRFGMRGASRSTLVVALASSGATALARGPFVAAVGDRPSAVAFAQLFIVVTALSAYLLAAVTDDLHDRREVEEQLRHLAYHDTLTGLPNRAHLAEVLESVAEFGEGAAVLIVDVDDFKVVNDAMGHPRGDELLVAVAQRLRRCLRPGDTLARLSGDEFVVVLPAAGDVVADRVARRMLQQVSVPLPLGGRGELRPSVSIGIACGSDSFEVEGLLAEADAALYRAKERGKARSSRFDDELRAEVGDRLLIMTDVDPAMRDGTIHWLHQPEVDLRSGGLFGLEALCRWDHPTGAIGPDRFVPVLESSGYAGRLFAGALDAALTAQREVAALSTHVPNVAVNVSATLLSDSGLVGRVRAELEQRRCPPGTLWLEVTESALATPRAAQSIEELHDAGVRLAIDDFGTGWSSLGRLAEFRWDLLKIDRSFVSRLGEEEHIAHLVEAVVAMAHSLEILVAAEGVETERQLRMVRDLGCDVAQGWLFARAAGADEVAALVDHRGRWIGPSWDKVRPTGQVSS